MKNIIMNILNIQYFAKINNEQFKIMNSIYKPFDKEIKLS